MKDWLPSSLGIIEIVARDCLCALQVTLEAYECFCFGGFKKDGVRFP